MVLLYYVIFTKYMLDHKNFKIVAAIGWSVGLVEMRHSRKTSQLTPVDRAFQCFGHEEPRTSLSGVLLREETSFDLLLVQEIAVRC